MDFRVNHPIIFVMVGIIIAVVMAQSVFFLVRALKRAKAIGMDKKVLKKTMISSAVFTIAPAVSIVVGVIALSHSLGIPLPWLRLSVIGSLSYELIAAERALAAFGLNFAGAITDPQIYVTVTWVMTFGIAAGLLFTPLFAKKIQNGMEKIEKSDKKWREILTNAMFLGMVSAFLGFVFCDVANVFKGDTSGLIPVVVFGFSAIIMALCGLCSIKLKQRWMNDYALPISLIAGMAIAIPVTAWLG
ncbi:MAG: DUF5058 family protein [Clostridia bacterium]|nr:DUF5058 family protein [Clostridia bacterium]